MRVIEFDSPESSAELVANEILSALAQKPDLVLGLATGSTPIGVYQRLVAAKREGRADFSQVRTFNLDEYVGLSAEHPQSYRYFMREQLFAEAGIPEEHVHFPPTELEGLAAACAAYEAAIRDCGGIDIQILGLGSNGHIGFNEPTSSLASRTRLKTLASKTIEDNARFYSPGEEQPQLATTMGIGTIMDAKCILLQAFGQKKAPAVHAAIEGAISSFCPATVLQMHPHVSFLLDADSASLLTMRDYYRRVRENELRLQQPQH
ncbi:MAG: glucosamine-6-phosphate deaminase [Planctomycetota bacterium]|nr:MAG: glucosamine-6-phosphate deaminase [Planctomycetota bacterium]